MKALPSRQSEIKTVVIWRSRAPEQANGAQELAKLLMTATAASATLIHMIIAIDTGGTKTLICRFDTDGVKHHIAKFPTPRGQADYLTTVADTIRNAIDVATIDAVAIAVPGPIVDGRLLRAKNIGDEWRNIDISTAISERLDGVPVYTANDADLAGLSEARALDTPPRVNLYVTLSTGAGTGLAFDGHLSDSLSHIEGGWMRLLFEGRPQMWEDFASGRSFYERYGQFGSDVDDPDKWRDFAHRASLGLIALIPMLGPDHVVIGGSMGTHFAKYADYLRAEVAEALPEFDTSLITQAKHPEEAVIYGCYYYAVDQLATVTA